MSDVAPALDFEAALERAGGDEDLLAEIAQMCLDDLPGMIGEVQAGLAASNAKAVRMAAHKLKGSLVAVAAQDASAAAYRLEDLGARDCLDQAAAALQALEGEIERIRPALARFAKGDTLP